MRWTLLLIVALPTVGFAQDTSAVEKWGPVSVLIGTWEGTGIGRWGTSKVFREYAHLMGGTYIIGKNRSEHERQQVNPGGETHDNWDIFSYDRRRAKYVLRQFHAEDITNTYGLASTKLARGVCECESEAIENLREGWRAEEVYMILSEDEFIEIFLLSAPGEEFQEYVRNTFHRSE